MKITTPNGILEGENIEAILKEHGLDCLRGADLNGADLSYVILWHANLNGADLSGANLAGAAAGVRSMIRDKRTEPTKSPTTASRTGTH